MSKLTLAVLFGGCSAEYAVSLQSAAAVIRSLDRRKYQLVLLGISREGAWYRYYGTAQKIAEDTWCNERDCRPAYILPCRKTQGLLEEVEGQLQVSRLDAALPLLHGRFGEDGTVQGLLELAGIPIVGCATLASALCMDKVRAHALVNAAGIDIPRSQVVESREAEAVVAARAESLRFPLIVKPVRGGSSLGVSCARRPEDLPSALCLAGQYDDLIIMEEKIDGIEIGCAILGSGEQLTVGELDEIEIADDFFDFQEKYGLAHSTIHMPARVPAGLAERLKRTAVMIYQVLGCSGFARVDMFLTPRGEIYFNEVNTIPGFTGHSRYANMLRGIGLSFPQVVEQIIESAVKPVCKHVQKSPAIVEHCS